MNQAARRLSALLIWGSLAAPLAADPGEADRLLKRGFPDKDFSGAPIKLVVAGQQCVLAASAWSFDKDGTAKLKDAAVVRIRVVGPHEVVEVASGSAATVTFDRPVTSAAEFGKSKIVAIETADGKVIRLK
jgi:hypothetical protein